MSRATADADLYEQDFYAWTERQAGKLRALQEQRENLDLDLPHLIEEVEDLGKSQRDAVRSQVERIIEHCLKLEYSGAEAPRLGWFDSIDDARDEIGYKLTPTLRRDLEQEVPRLYERTRRRTARSLRRHGEPDAADALPTICPYTLDDLLQEDWYPASRRGIVD